MRATCGFGHLYDSDQYASCPYCNRGAKALFFPGNGVETGANPVNYGENRTVAPGFGGAQGFGAPAYGQPDAVGKTVMPDYMRDQCQKENDNKTVAIYKQKYGMDPVVGWLVCVEGPEKGKDYRLYNKINTIGRSEDNDVVLEKEQTVSQRNHARLAYDAKHNNFQIIPGDGSNIAYVNDAPLYIPQLLSAYDVIEFGGTKLMFVPFCTAQFQWNQEDKK